MEFRPRELKAMRIKKGISQKAMAAALCQTNAAYCMKENGKRKLALKEVIGISQYLNLTSEEIINIFFGKEINLKDNI